ncbi:MAG: hypothetical protein R3288_10465 [Woeseiaceae bacterium]|nr:hypothetical protein [Woeseiaceae bacterium]
MQGRRNPFIAREGIPFVLASLGLCWYASRYLAFEWLLASFALFVVLFLVFRDPRRQVPAVALGVISPVDGRVVAIEQAETGVLQGKAHRIVLRINSLGTYTARSPVEGKVMDLHSGNGDQAGDYPKNALWLKTDEGDDVVLQFGGYRFGLPPKSLTRFGERLGQGTRCAYLRLTRTAEVHLPVNAKVLVTEGQAVVAGRDVLARLHSS